MKKIFLAIILVCSLFPFSLIAGRYAGDFMAIGAGVRSISMGGAFAAIFFYLRFRIFVKSNYSPSSGSPR